MQTISDYLRAKAALANLPCPQLHLGELFDPVFEHKPERDSESEESDQGDVDAKDVDAKDVDAKDEVTESAEVGQKHKLDNPEERPANKRPKTVSRKGMLSQLESSLAKLGNGLPYVAHADFDAFDFVLLKSVDDGEITMPLPKDGLALMMQHCKPSAFGDLKTQTTKVDKDVRLAYELPGSNLTLTTKATNFLDAFSKHVSRYLFAGRRIRLQLNKLNVYPKDGMFKAHVDTPRENMMGTVLVELPYLYQGGQLVIEPTTAGNEDKKVATFSSMNADEDVGAEDNGTRGMQAIAFYGHCPHRVDPVLSGHRVTLSFYIMSEDSASVGEHKAGLDIKIGDLDWDMNDKKYLEYDLGGVFCALSFKKAKLQHEHLRAYTPTLLHAATQGAVEFVRTFQEPLGIFLAHSYSDSERKNGNLKGTDAFLVDQLTQLVGESGGNMTLKLLPVVVEHHETYGEGYDWSGEQDVYRFTEEDVKSLLGRQTFTENEYEDADIVFVGDLGATGEKVTDDGQQYVQHTGNESQEGLINNQYFSNALILAPVGVQKKKVEVEPSPVEVEVEC